MKQWILVIAIAAFSLNAAAQDCEVKLEAIKGTYYGECADGKAQGKGKSTGIDEYEGEFKKGYPDGKGMYIWKDGHYFIGSFKKGVKEGEGDMYYESASGQDSVITGFWKKDKYIGLYEKQFVVINTTARVNKVDCRLIDAKGEDIFITVHQMTGGGNVYTNTAPLTITEITNTKGRFYARHNLALTNSSQTRLQQVLFPYRAIIYLSNGENVEIQFNEKGNYDVAINTQ